MQLVLGVQDPLETAAQSGRPLTGTGKPRNEHVPGTGPLRAVTGDGVGTFRAEGHPQAVRNGARDTGQVRWSQAATVTVGGDAARPASRHEARVAPRGTAAQAARCGGPGTKRRPGPLGVPVSEINVSTTLTRVVRTSSPGARERACPVPAKAGSGRHPGDRRPRLGPVERRQNFTRSEAGRRYETGRWIHVDA